MSNDSDDPDSFVDSPEKPLNLKTCPVFKLPAADVENLPKGWPSLWAFLGNAQHNEGA